MSSEVVSQWPKIPHDTRYNIQCIWLKGMDFKRDGFRCIVDSKCRGRIVSTVDELRHYTLVYGVCKIDMVKL